MGLDYLVIIFTKFFNIISWPPFTVVYPLYASIRAVESNQHYQQCLAYWVLFSLTTILELPFTKILQWLPFWPYAKGLAVLVLVTPYFCGASYIYINYIRPCICRQTQEHSITIASEKKNSALYENIGFPESAQEQIEAKGDNELLELAAFKDGTSSNCYTEKLSPTWAANLQKVKKEWSYAVCLMSTASRKYLKNHMQGNNVFLEDQLRKVEMVTKKTADMSLTMTGIREKVSLPSFNQKLSGLLNPVTRSVRWCTWKKPELGWMKLNTDGYIDKEGSGFGGLIRDYKGDPVCAYSSKASHDDIFMVELWAIWRGLVLALSLKINILWIESDSKSVVDTINRKQPYGPKPSGCLKHIWEMLGKFDKYHVSHTWREANRAADRIAKMNLLGSDVVIRPSDFSDVLCKIIKEDAQGIRYDRL